VAQGHEQRLSIRVGEAACVLYARGDDVHVVNVANPLLESGCGSRQRSAQLGGKNVGKCLRRVPQALEGNAKPVQGAGVVAWRSAALDLPLRAFDRPSSELDEALVSRGFDSEGQKSGEQRLTLSQAAAANEAPNGRAQALLAPPSSRDPCAEVGRVERE
jgi:hypothetical protein